jgi:hypothetical protein
LTYAAEIAWQSVVAATFVLSHALYARATMMQKRTSLVDDTLTRVCRAPLNTAGCVKSHTGGAGTARNLTEAVLGAVATALAAPTNATGYKGECIDSLVDEVRAESARGAALGTFAAIVIGCVASGVGGLRAPFVLVVHALVVADSAIETLYSGWSNTYGCSEVTDYAAAVWPIVKLATAWLIFCISNRRSELLLRTQFVQMLRLKQMNLDSEVHLNPFSPALLARWMKKKRAKSGKRRASPSTLLRAARRTALLAGGHSVGDDLSDASDVDVNGSALSSPLSRSRARDPTSERTAVAPLALLGALGGSSMPQGRGHGRYASVDERLLRGSMHADRAMSTSSRGSNLRVGEGDSSGFGGLLPRLDSNYSQFHVPVSAALNRWDIPFTSIVQGRKISAGGSGQIYRAAFDGQPVAMKQLFSAMVTGDLDEFSREVSVLSSLGNHPNVLTLYGITKVRAFVPLFFFFFSSHFLRVFCFAISRRTTIRGTTTRRTPSRRVKRRRCSPRRHSRAFTSSQSGSALETCRTRSRSGVTILCRTTATSIASSTSCLPSARKSPPRSRSCTRTAYCTAI